MGTPTLQENAVMAFKESLFQHLKEIGVIGAMKTQLHRRVLEKLPQNAELPSSKLQQKAPSAFGFITDNLIAEYLAASRMEVTLNAFQSESGLRSTRLGSAQILQLLNIKHGTSIWEALSAQGVHLQDAKGTPNGLAVALLEAIAVVSLHEQTCMGASQKMTKYQDPIHYKSNGMQDAALAGRDAVDKYGEAHQGLVADLQKRARVKEAAACRSEAAQRRSADDANLALDEAVDILEASMRALEDLRSRFAASQRTVGHLSRQLIAAQLHQQASPESAFCTAVALEAQEAQLSRHQTAARVERREEALQQRILALKRSVCRQRAAAVRRLASASVAPGRPSLAAVSTLSASCLSGAWRREDGSETYPDTRAESASSSLRESSCTDTSLLHSLWRHPSSPETSEQRIFKGHKTVQQQTSAETGDASVQMPHMQAQAAAPSCPSAPSAIAEQEDTRCSASHDSCDTQESADDVAASLNKARKTSDQDISGTAAEALDCATPDRLPGGLDRAGSAAERFSAKGLQNETPPVGSEALSLDRTVASICDLLTNTSPDPTKPEERAAVREDSAGEAASDSHSDHAQHLRNTTAFGGATEPVSCPQNDANSESGDSRAESEHFTSDREHEIEQAVTSSLEDLESENAGFDTEQEEALMAALGLDSFSDASIEEEDFGNNEENGDGA